MSEKGEVMTREEKIKVLAELDGWKWIDHPDTIKATESFKLKNKWVIQPDGQLNFPHNAPRYLTSYDAIIPLIQKQSRDTKEETGSRIVEMLTESDTNIMDGTPEQLADALIKAVGKWGE